jgi:glycosyltransferase involved in cell wall biosynthesis
MKVLHLISDKKWTGPVEPAYEMVKGLRSEGVDAQLARSAAAVGRDPDPLKDRAEAASVPLIEEFALRKHFHLRDNLRDIMRLTKFIRGNGFDIVHTHRHQDHLIGGIAAKRAQRPLVRSSHDGLPLKNNWRNRYLMRNCTTLYLPVSERAAEADQRQFQINPMDCVVCPPAIDTEVFDPYRNFNDMRAQLGIPKDKTLIGIVARMQRHRHFEDLLDSWVRVLQKRNDVHFVIVGRGTNQDEVAKQPAQQKGLSDNLTFAGYHSETYLDMLASLDIKMFLVPGSDGSCRALRQALALGIPAVTTERGMLPEIVQDGQNGLVTDGSPEALAEAQLTLLAEPELRGMMGENARKISVEKHALKEQTKALIAHYETILQESPDNSP